MPMSGKPFPKAKRSTRSTGWQDVGVRSQADRDKQTLAIASPLMLVAAVIACAFGVAAILDMHISTWGLVVGLALLIVGAMTLVVMADR